MSIRVDLTGQRFGKLVVIKELPRERDENGLIKWVDGKKPPIKWLCKCDCGNTCETTSANLRGGKSSCGCAVAELREKQRQQLAAAREASKQARAKEIEMQHRCPYPDASCTKSKKGMCCWDCEEYEACEAKGRVCKNNPAKCGVKKYGK